MRQQQHGSMRYAWLTAAAASMGGFLFGYASGCINGTVLALEQAFHASGLGSGFAVASMLLGCAAGALLAGPLSDVYGRRAVLRAAALFFAGGAYGSGVALSTSTFIVFRLLSGLGVGAVSILVPAYISEIAPPAVRGRMACLQQLAIGLGLFAAFLVNEQLARAAGGAECPLWWNAPAWRWMYWAQLVPVAVYAAGMAVIPESPRCLTSAGHLQEARRVLTRLAPAADAEATLRDIRQSLIAGHRPSPRDVLDSGTGLPHPVVRSGLLIAMFQQFVGINIIFYYGEVLWRAAGFSAGDALDVNLLSGVLNVAATVAAILLIDNWGRRPLLLAGSLGMSLMLAALAVIFALAPAGADGALRLTPLSAVLALLAAHAYIVAFGMSWGPVVWVLLGEMFPNRMRGAALALAGLAQWLANFLVSMSFPWLRETLGLGGAYALYAGAALLSAVVVLRTVRETKGVTLEHMRD